MIDDLHSPPWLSRLADRLPAWLPRRFLKFCVVGASGVVVNLAMLAAFAEGLGVHANVSSALAIAVSIFSNYLLNDAWTFGDRRGAAIAPWARLTTFYAVSLVGAAIQWIVFVSLNAALADHLPLAAGTDAIRMAIVDPPEVGAWKYLSQLVGVAVGTVWNFTANVWWTWRPAHGLGGRGR